MKHSVKQLGILSLVLVLSAVTGAEVLAQGGRPQGPPQAPSDKQIEKMIKELDKELELSDTQLEKVSAIYYEHFDEVEALQQGNSRPDRSKMEALKTEMTDSVKAVLNEAQQEKYTELLEDEVKQGPPGGGRPQGRR